MKVREVEGGGGKSWSPESESDPSVRNEPGLGDQKGPELRCRRQKEPMISKWTLSMRKERLLKNQNAEEADEEDEKAEALSGPEVSGQQHVEALVDPEIYGLRLEHHQ